MRIPRTASFGLLLLVAACSSTQLSEVRKEPGYQGRPIRKVLVIGVVPSESQRREFEDRLTADLARRQVIAIPSHRYLPYGKSVTGSSVGDLVRREGFDAVLISQVTGVTHGQQFIPGGYPYHGDLLDGWVPGSFYAPGYYQPTRNVRVETNLYQGKEGGGLIWSAVSNTINPPSSARAVNEVSDKVVGRMHKDGVV